MDKVDAFSEKKKFISKMKANTKLLYSNGFNPFHKAYVQT